MGSLAHLTSYYPEVLGRFYSENPAFRQECFETQQKALLALKFAWSDVWKHTLAPIGYNVLELIVNAEPLQRAWAEEQGVRFNEATWRFDVALLQLLRLKPDYIFLDDFSVFTPAQLQKLKEALPKVILIGWCGAPYSSVELFKGYNFVLSNIPDTVAELRRAGHTAFLLRHAFDRRVADMLETASNQLTRLTFSGSLSFFEDSHLSRAKFIDELAQVVPMAIGSELFDRIPALERRICSSFPSLHQAMKILRPRIHALRPAAIKALEPAKYGMDMYRFLAGSVATFNRHISVSAKRATNMRLFEATGSQACLVTERTDDLATLFEPDVEVVTYASVTECKEKVAWLLDHPQEARKIARRGQMRTLREHTFEERALEFDAILRNYKKAA
jgi:spore maturation protein CgeB